MLNGQPLNLGSYGHTSLGSKITLTEVVDLCSLSLLLQLQATMLSLLACVLSTVFGWITEGKMAVKHVVILCSACISSSFLASLIQGTKT